MSNVSFTDAMDKAFDKVRNGEPEGLIEFMVAQNNKRVADEAATRTIEAIHNMQLTVLGLTR